MKKFKKLGILILLLRLRLLQPAPWPAHELILSSNFSSNVWVCLIFGNGIEQILRSLDEKTSVQK